MNNKSLLYLLKLSLVHNPRGSLMVGAYRVANFSSRKKRELKYHLVWAAPVLILYRFFTELIFGYEIPAATEIGKGFLIDHGYGLVINKHTRIGDYFRVKHGVTIGCKTLPCGGQGPSPKIGDNVDVGANAMIIGDVNIGSHVKIGAGAIVTKDVPSYCVVVPTGTQRIIMRSESDGQGDI